LFSTLSFSLLVNRIFAPCPSDLCCFYSFFFGECRCTCLREMQERHTAASAATVHVSKQQKTNESVAISVVSGRMFLCAPIAHTVGNGPELPSRRLHLSKTLES
jgi:hypothetical protein